MDAKIASKVLALKRLEKTLPEIIHSVNQNAFVKGRTIFDASYLICTPFRNVIKILGIYFGDNEKERHE